MSEAVSKLNPNDPPYKDHVRKIAALHAKRTKEWSEDAFKQINSIEKLVDTLCGDMLLPPLVEARMWFTMIQGVQSRGGVGLRLQPNDAEPWSILDMTLGAATAMPCRAHDLRVAIAMMATGVFSVLLCGQTRTLPELFLSTKDLWSTTGSLAERSNMHFRCGVALTVAGDLHGALDEFLDAACHQPSEAAETQQMMASILDPIVERELKTTAGRHMKLNGKGVVRVNDCPLVDYAAEHKVILTEQEEVRKEVPAGTTPAPTAAAAAAVNEVAAADAASANAEAAATATNDGGDAAFAPAAASDEAVAAP